jgi:hypothetical protein
VIKRAAMESGSRRLIVPNAGLQSVVPHIRSLARIPFQAPGFATTTPPRTLSSDPRWLDVPTDDRNVSDPVFSINDTLAWYHKVHVAQGGTAQDFVRVFPVPGMAHCGGGPATDSFDAFSPLRSWVESGKAPDQIEARAGPQTPWPGRSRPLCPYPAIARYSGHGDAERAESFICQRSPVLGP